MNEKDIIIAGHGSGNPSTKSLYTYCESRHSQKMSNGMTKELLEVRRFLTPEQAQKYHDNYAILIGRNIYDQNLRQYVYEKYPKTGKYYSDCSSSICATYKRCGKDVGLLNTDGMHNAGTKVDVRIVNGHIVEEDLPKLQVGDALLFRGNINRPWNGYIGHVEAVYQLPKDGEWIDKNGTWYYKKPDGNLAKSEWLVINHHWYYFDENSKMLTGWQRIWSDKRKVDEWYYFEDAGDFEGALWHSDSNGAQTRWYVN